MESKTNIVGGNVITFFFDFADIRRRQSDVVGLRVAFEALAEGKPLHSEFDESQDSTVQLTLRGPCRSGPLTIFQADLG